MRWRVAMVCAVSCGGGTGAFLSITPPAGTQQVEMLVAPSACMSGGEPCADGISWGSNIEPPSGTIFDLVNDERNLISVPRAGTFTLKLEATNGSDGTPDRIAFVAFDGQGSAIGLGVLSQPVVPTSDMATLDVTLAPIVEMDPANPALNTSHVWRPVPGRPAMEGDGYPSCVATRTSNGVEFYVPSDHDCDNQSMECNDFWFDYTSSTRTPCVTPANLVCTVGNAPCMDGHSATCTAQFGPQMCVPDAVCSCATPDSALSCFRNTINNAYGSGSGSGSGSSTLTYADCKFTQDGTTVCGSNNTTASVVVQIQKNCTTLSTVSLYKVAIPLGTPLAVATGSQGSGTSFGSGQASLQLDLAVPSCGARLTWVAGSGSGAAPTSLPLLVLDFQPNAATHILLPLRLEFMPVAAGACDTSSTPPSCDLQGSGFADHVFQCGA